MEKVLGPLMGAEVSVYIDDMLVATETMERHVEVLKQVFQALRKAHLKLKPQKCRILESSVEFLGHVVDNDGLRTDPGKVEKIRDYPQPTNLSQLRTFLGMTGYYRKFILRYAQIAQPLYDLTSTKTPFLWTGAHQQAFATLKDLLTRAPVLGQPDIEAARKRLRPFYIYTDASRSGLGAVLAQEGNDKLIHPLHFASRGLSRAEKNYHITDQEALGVMFAVKKFHYFIYGVHTIVRTDHSALTSLFKRANVSPRILR
nr:RNA-directed DNA polymerase (reverse transcriptase) domain containing protein [Haemonchus contortus]